MSNPKISIALAGRNDNYGRHYLDRLKLCIRAFYNALEGIDYEIVLVDYNPPKHKPLLSECLKGFNNIKHVVFSRKDHLNFINYNCDIGAQLKLGRNIIPRKQIYKYGFFANMANHFAIKHCSGEYILSTASDIIFPVQFKQLINKLQPNILYRTWSYYNKYKISISTKIIFDYFNELINGTQYKSIKGGEFGKYIVKKNSIWNAAGAFILTDKKTWRQIGGYIPLMAPRIFAGDNQVIFNAVAYNKKIQCVSFPVFSIKFIGSMGQFDRSGNYIVKNNNIIYDHTNELGNMKKKSTSSEWIKYRRWSRKVILSPNQTYFLKINYKNRHKQIKKLFKSFLPDEFLIY